MLSGRQNLQCVLSVHQHLLCQACSRIIESTYQDNMKRFTLMTWLFMAMCKLGRCRIGRKNAFAVEHLFKSRWKCTPMLIVGDLIPNKILYKKKSFFYHLDPLRIVPWGIMNPVWNSPLPSLFWIMAILCKSHFNIDFILSSIIPDIPFLRQLQQRRLRVVSCESEIEPQGKCKSEVMWKSKRRGSRVESEWMVHWKA